MSMLLERLQIAESFPVVDLQTAANTGDWISMRQYDRLLILFASGVGTASDDPTITISQASDNAGTGSKALNIVTTPVQVWKKQAATSLAAVGQWSDASAGVTANAWTDLTSAEQDLLLAIEFKADQLDVDNGFDHVQASVDDIGSNAQPGVVLMILGDPSHEKGVTGMLSALA